MSCRHVLLGISTVISIVPPHPVFDFLRPHVIWDALYSSSKRAEEHAVICQPETQTKILGEVRSWANSATSPRICWLSGPAGTGKTTVAHTIAEEYDKRGQLAATFFFWRKTGDRDDINKLVATLAYQIASRIPQAKDQMEQTLELKNNSWVPLPKLSLEHQLSKLLVRGQVAGANPAGPNLIVIDGLDECASQVGIYWLIDWLRRNNPPFRFLLTSRPEPQIEACFRPGDGRSYAQLLSLTESEDNIRKYFVTELEKVWPEEQRVKDGGPPKWPSESDLSKLVEKSEGLFVYAATAVRYISGKGYPKTLLENVLELHKGLDPLYAQVIKAAKEWNDFDTVMGAIMYLRYPLGADNLSEVLVNVDKRLEGPAIRSALNGCHSILVIPGNDEVIESYHASLRDFLTNKFRSNTDFYTLFYNPAMSHGQLMVGCLEAITRAFSDGSRAPRYPLISWYYHACVFLSEPGTSEELGGLKDKTGELMKKIDVKWVKSWMVDALYWAGVPYLKEQLPPQKVRV